MDSSNSLKIYFGKDAANLYTIGYISSDIFQLLTFCEMLEKNDKENLEKYFFKESYRPYQLNRYNRVFRDTISASKISEVNKGSLELVIAGLSLVSSIVIPFVAVLFQERLQHHNQHNNRQIDLAGVRLLFNVNPDDIFISNTLVQYQGGMFGQGAPGLDNMIIYLGQHNYNVIGITPHVYDIYHVADQFARRIARTLNMN